MSEVHNSGFQEAIETVERLPLEDQALLIDIVRRHLIDQRRNQLADEIAESRAEYRRGKVNRGTAEDVIRELAE